MNHFATDEDLAPETAALAVLVHEHLDAAILVARRRGLRPQKRVSAVPQRLGHDGPVEHGTIHDDGFRFPAIDLDSASGGREYLRTVDPSDDRLLAGHDVEDSRGDESAALDRLSDLPVLLENRDVVARLRDPPRGVPARGPSPDNDDVELLRPRRQADPLTPSPSSGSEGTRRGARRGRRCP